MKVILCCTIVADLLIWPDLAFKVSKRANDVGRILEIWWWNLTFFCKFAQRAVHCCQKSKILLKKTLHFFWYLSGCCAPPQKIQNKSFKKIQQMSKSGPRRPAYLGLFGELCMISRTSSLVIGLTLTVSYVSSNLQTAPPHIDTPVYSFTRLPTSNYIQ